jgi:hypothetical protein
MVIEHPADPTGECRARRAGRERLSPVRSYRFYGFTEDGAAGLADALGEDGMRTDRLAPGSAELPGWVVVAHGEDRSEGLLEMLAQLYGGCYEGEDLAGA